ncbi:MAG: polyprenyl synthetase family protein [Bryobacterales bacterium]|nr:polyprenyl synthetase family protein [Bryobacterales bacterium]
MTIHDYMARQAARVNEALERLTPPEQTAPETIHRAMRYSLFAGGKRIRPVLAMAAADAVTPEMAGIEDAACALEMIHTYSLIHDDLPALDNDDLRRGRPTCHKVFGEAMAILAGDALLTLAFEVLAKLPYCGPMRRARIITEVAASAGTQSGMIGGQVQDLEGEGQPPTAELLHAIHKGKTGALLRASVRLGGLYAGASDLQYEALSLYGNHIGLAFQIVDDILDIEQSSEQLGKTAGKDAAQGKITFPAVYGLAGSREMADEQLELALSAVEPFGARAHWLRELAMLVVRRRS